MSQLEDAHALYLTQPKDDSDATLPSGGRIRLQFPGCECAARTDKFKNALL